MTGTDLCRRALRILGVHAPGESIPAAELVDAMTALAGMLGQWGTQTLTMYVVESTQFDLDASQASYTVGSGGDVNIARPTFLERASVISLADPTQPLELPIEVIRTDQRWQEVHLKSLEGGWPLGVYYQKTFPLATLYVWPIPDISTLDLKLYYRTRVTGFANASTNYTFPDGYEDALAYNLALRLAPEWGVVPTEEVKTLARQTLANIKRVNQSLTALRLDPAVHGPGGRGSQYDIRSDD